VLISTVMVDPSEKNSWSELLTSRRFQTDEIALPQNITVKACHVSNPAQNRSGTTCHAKALLQDNPAL
jgi:hypothetical protein